MLCQAINDLYIGQGNPAPTNGVIHHLSVDRTLSLQLVPVYYLLIATLLIE